jgi:HEAT repeat protein
MLGGNRRAKIDRELFRKLLNIDDPVTRSTAIERILDQGAGRFYGAAMIAALTPGARYYQIGRLWKVEFSYEQKLAAMDSLVKLDPERGLGGLVVALGNDDTTLQCAAIWLISQLETPEADSVLLTILEDHRQEIRHAALQAIGHRWKQPQISRLANPHGSVVAEAAVWLTAHSDQRAIPILGSILKDQRRGLDNQEFAQKAVISALGILGRRFAAVSGSYVVSLLRDLLDYRPGLSMLKEIVHALEVIGTDEAMAAAIVYANDFVANEANQSVR